MVASLTIDWRAVRAEQQGRHPLNTSHTDEWTEEELEFHAAVRDYKEACRRPFPDWSEVLAIFLALGYRRPVDAPRYNRSRGDRRPRGQRPKPAPIPFPRQG